MEISECERDLYKILGLSTHANGLQIRQAYLQLKRAYGEGSQALYSLIDEEERLSSLQEVEYAFEILNDVEKRREYDALHRWHGPESTVMKSSSIGGGLDRSIEVQNYVEAGRDGWKSEKYRHQNSSKTLRRVASKSIDTRVKSDVQCLLLEAEDVDGSLLEKVRQTIGLSIAEVAEHTKISESLLRSLEQNDFDQLPQTAYVKGFLRSYLGFMGIMDSQNLIDAYIRRVLACKKKI
ncbi:MAG: helix-turn-helix domain-containing protein [Bdellovibrionota bacterium]